MRLCWCMNCLFDCLFAFKFRVCLRIGHISACQTWCSATASRYDEISLENNEIHFNATCVLSDRTCKLNSNICVSMCVCVYVWILTMAFRMDRSSLYLIYSKKVYIHPITNLIWKIQDMEEMLTIFWQLLFDISKNFLILRTIRICLNSVIWEKTSKPQHTHRSKITDSWWLWHNDKECAFSTVYAIKTLSMYVRRLSAIRKVVNHTTHHIEKSSRIKYNETHSKDIEFSNY